MVHNSSAISEGLRLQRRKSVLVAEAETIIDLSLIVGAKLEVMCQREEREKTARRQRDADKMASSKTGKDVMEEPSAPMSTDCR